MFDPTLLRCCSYRFCTVLPSLHYFLHYQLKPVLLVGETCVIKLWNLPVRCGTSHTVSLWLIPSTYMQSAHPQSHTKAFHWSWYINHNS